MIDSDFFCAILDSIAGKTNTRAQTALDRAWAERAAFFDSCAKAYDDVDAIRKDETISEEERETRLAPLLELLDSAYDPALKCF
jgi:1,2-phenylacetyl-CoA epoxidase catalytic subunit